MMVMLFPTVDLQEGCRWLVLDQLNPVVKEGVTEYTPQDLLKIN